jgi:hypothetical protein
MNYFVTWPDGSKTKELIYQKYRHAGEMEQREDYYIIKTFSGACAIIYIDQNCLKIEKI